MRAVLDKLEKEGYKVVASCGVGQTCVWTMHKEDSAGDGGGGGGGSS